MHDGGKSVAGRYNHVETGVDQVLHGIEIIFIRAIRGKDILGLQAQLCADFLNAFPGGLVECAVIDNAVAQHADLQRGLRGGFRRALGLGARLRLRGFAAGRRGIRTAGKGSHGQRKYQNNR